MAIVINGTGTIAGVSATGITTAPTNATDTSKLPLAGGTLTGDLKLSNNKSLFLLDNAGQKSGQIQTDSSASNSLQIDADPDNSASDSYTAFRIDNSEKMRIDSSGQVGIGTTTPARILHVSDTTSGATTGIRLTGANNGSQVIEFADTDDTNVGYIQYDHGTNRISIRAGDANRLNIDSDGLKFGTDTAAANALDDYEEGTFTPSFSGNIAFSTKQNFTYTKIGSLVHITGYLNGASGTFGTSFAVTGLPFGGNAAYNLAPLWSHGVDLMYMVYMTTSAAMTIRDRDGASMNGTSELSLQFTYRTNS